MYGTSRVVRKYLEVKRILRTRFQFGVTWSCHVHYVYRIQFRVSVTDALVPPSVTLTNESKLALGMPDLGKIRIEHNLIPNIERTWTEYLFLPLSVFHKRPSKWKEIESNHQGRKFRSRSHLLDEPPPVDVTHPARHLSNGEGEEGAVHFMQNPEERTWWIFVCTNATHNCACALMFLPRSRMTEVPEAKNCS